MRSTVLPMDRLAARSVEIPCLIKGVDLPCWVTVRGRNFYGYSRIKINGKEVGAHRFSYMELRGEIPPGLELDHLCRNRACWNPWHVEPVTGSVNCLRGLTGMSNARVRKGMIPIKKLEKS